MQIIKTLATAALAASVGGAALAGPAAYRLEARLASPAASPREAAIAGVIWRCDGETCVGEAPARPNLDGLVRACRRVSETLGALTSYRSGARALTKGQLAACNRAAPKVAVGLN